MAPCSLADQLERQAPAAHNRARLFAEKFQSHVQRLALGSGRAATRYQTRKPAHCKTFTKTPLPNCLCPMVWNNTAPPTLSGHRNQVHKFQLPGSCFGTHSMRRRFPHTVHRIRYGRIANALHVQARGTGAGVHTAKKQGLVRKPRLPCLKNHNLTPS